MIKNYFFTITLAFASLQVNAQLKVQGELRKDLNINTLNSKKVDNAFTFDDVKFWVGEGSNKAALVIQWNNTDKTDALVWGYRFDGEKNGTDMLKEIAKNDPRLYLLILESTRGTKIGGIGFDNDSKGAIGLYKDDKKTSPNFPTNGFTLTSEYDFDQWSNLDLEDHWATGWLDNGFWTYWTKNIDEEFDYSGLDSDARLLVDGSWDLWSFAYNSEDYDLSDTFTAVEDYQAPNYDYNNGVFIVNEDWFGHSNGSVNFVSNEGQVQHNSFKNVNPTNDFGVTTQFGTIYGDNFYFVSKQGNRLVVADAQTLEHKKSFETIGGKDGRSFVGVNSKNGYIGTSDGIFLFDIENLSIGELIPGTEGNQIGNMLRSSNYVFATKQGTGILIIDPKTNQIIQTISGSYISVVQSKDGNIWGALSNKLVKINPKTFETEEIDIPTKTIPNSWGAWNAGSFTASTQENELYFFPGSGWSTSSIMVKYNIDTNSFNEEFISLPDQDQPNNQTPYGAALRVDPISNELVVTSIESGWGTHSEKNWVHRYKSTGEWVSTIPLSNYYWFPALPVFPDVYAPEIVNLESSYELIVGDDALIIDLKDKVSDLDNITASIVKDLEIVSNNEVVDVSLSDDGLLTVQGLNSGSAKISVNFTSNGKTVSQEINFVIKTLGLDDVNSKSTKIYPNPVTDFLTIESKTNQEVKAYSVLGQLVLTTNLKVGKNQINLSSLPKGNYIVNIGADSYKIIKK